MAWFLLLIALACLVMGFFAASIALGIGCMLLSLLLLLVAMLMLLSARRGATTRER